MGVPRFARRGARTREATRSHNRPVNGPRLAQHLHADFGTLPAPGTRTTAYRGALRPVRSRTPTPQGGGDGPRTLIRPRLRPFYGAVERSPSITRSPTRRPQRAATKSVLREQRTAERAVRSCVGSPVLGGPDLFLYPSVFAGTSVECLGNDFSCLVADKRRDRGIGIERSRFLGDALTLLDRHFPDHPFQNGQRRCRR